MLHYDYAHQNKGGTYKPDDWSNNKKDTKDAPAPARKNTP